MSFPLLTSDQQEALIEKAVLFNNWHASASMLPIIADLKEEGTTLLDLSAKGEAGAFENIFQAPALLEEYVNAKIEQAGVKYAVGGFCERRKLYQAEQYLATGPIRDIHLGYDIWGPVNTLIHAPLDATVHSFAFDPAEGSYGATIILEHSPTTALTFYTLYGHLTRQSLDQLEIGQHIPAGAAFAAFGDRNDNGNWPPHLHFQVILDMLGYTGDFPGVFSEATVQEGLLVCIDPAKYFQVAAAEAS